MNPKAIRQSAGRKLQIDPDSKRIALIYAAIVTIFSLVCTLLSWSCQMGIERNTGLSARTTRAMLESGQMLLSLVSTVVLPFLQVGFLFAALSYAKDETVTTDALKEGFRRWGPVLRLMGLMFLVITAISVICLYAAFTVFMISPFSDSLAAQMETLMQDPQAYVAMEETMQQLNDLMMPHMKWILAIFGVLFLGLGIPALYRCRISEYALMDNGKGAFAALKDSIKLTRGHVWDMLKLDLSFWWFFLLQAVIAVVAYGDQILPAVGVQLPIHEDVLFWAFYGVSMLGQFLITWLFSLRYQTAVGLLYLRLKERYFTPINPPPSSTEM